VEPGETGETVDVNGKVGIAERAAKFTVFV